MYRRCIKNKRDLWNKYLIVNLKRKKDSSVTGVEPATSGFEVQRAIHCATRPCVGWVQKGSPLQGSSLWLHSPKANSHCNEFNEPKQFSALAEVGFKFEDRNLERYFPKD